MKDRYFHVLISLTIKLVQYYIHENLKDFFLSIDFLGSQTDKEAIIKGRKTQTLEWGLAFGLHCHYYHPTSEYPKIQHWTL